MSIKKGVDLLFLILLFSGLMFLAFWFEQQSILDRCDLNQDGIVNNIDYLEAEVSAFAEIYSHAYHDPTGDGVWDESDKLMIINAWQAKEGEKKYDRRADLFPDGMINEVDMQMVRVEEKSQGQWLGNPLKFMNDLVRRIGWARRF